MESYYVFMCLTGFNCYYLFYYRLTAVFHDTYTYYFIHHSFTRGLLKLIHFCYIINSLINLSIGDRMDIVRS